MRKLHEHCTQNILIFCSNLLMWSFKVHWKLLYVNRKQAAVQPFHSSSVGSITDKQIGFFARQPNETFGYLRDWTHKRQSYIQKHRAYARKFTTF